MADELGSYKAAFYTAGAILIAGASIISLLKYTKKPVIETPGDEPSNENEDLLVVERVTVL